MVLGASQNIVQAAGNQWVLLHNDPDGIKLYEDKGSLHWNPDGTTLVFKVLYDYHNVRQGNPICSIVVDVKMPCLQEGPTYYATITARSIYAGQMGTGKVLSASTLPESAQEAEAKQFNTLICDAKD
jgi:hypothetical protein